MSPRCIWFTLLRNRKYLVEKLFWHSKRYRDSRDRENSVHKYRFRLSYPRRGKSAVRSKHRRETFHPDFSSSIRNERRGQPTRVGALFFFTQHSRHFALTRGKASSADDAVYTIRRTIVLQDRVHTLAPIPIIYIRVRHADVPRHMHIYTYARERASEPRPRRQVPFTHTLASQTDSQLESNILK